LYNLWKIQLQYAGSVITRELVDAATRWPSLGARGSGNTSIPRGRTYLVPPEPPYLSILVCLTQAPPSNNFGAPSGGTHTPLLSGQIFSYCRAPVTVQDLLSVISHISGHDVAGSRAVKHLREFTPLGVLTFQRPLKSTCKISHGVA
jgi:hypothetical protein